MRVLVLFTEEVNILQTGHLRPSHAHGRNALTTLELPLAGIGGIAAALSLGRRGHNVVILESAPKVSN